MVLCQWLFDYPAAASQQAGSSSHAGSSSQAGPSQPGLKQLEAKGREQERAAARQPHWR
jgi:hypothetical protein